MGLFLAYAQQPRIAER